MRRIAAALLVLAVLAPAPVRAEGAGEAVPSAAPARAAASPAPRRIASLNLCADELVLRLADPGRVISVTFLAQDPQASNVADLARNVPVNRGLAEEVVPLAPDLVLVGAFTTRATTAMLHRLGFEVLELPAPATLAQAYGQIRSVAARFGVPERGEAMVREMEDAFARLPPADAARPTAVVLRPNGFTTAGGSLADDLMAKAGLANLAASLPTDKMGQLALEEIVRAAPDLLVVNAEDDAPPSLAEALLHHPALAPFAAEGRTLSLPLRLWTCAGPELAEAAARLAAARTRLGGGAMAGAARERASQRLVFVAPEEATGAGVERTSPGEPNAPLPMTSGPGAQVSDPEISRVQIMDAQIAAAPAWRAEVLPAPVPATAGSGAQATGVQSSILQVSGAQVPSTPASRSEDLRAPLPTPSLPRDTPAERGR